MGMLPSAFDVREDGIIAGTSGGETLGGCGVGAEVIAPREEYAGF